MLFLHGIGHFHPNNIIDNQFLEDLKIDINPEWIIERVGIKERRTILSLDYIRETQNKNPAIARQYSQFSNAETAAIASRMAFDRANLSNKDIGMVIAGSCSPQYSLPADACAIAAELQIESPAFDLNSGCATFAVHMHFINQMQTESLPDYILLVIPDNSTRTINYSDRNTAVLCGDGTTAVIVSKKIKSHFTITSTMIDSNPAGWNKVILPSGEHFSQEGPSVQRFAIKKTLLTLEQLCKKNKIEHEDYYFIGHQANLTMLNSVCRIANIPSQNHLYNIEQFGNCGAAGAPSVLSQHWDNFKEGDKIVMAVVGAGLTWGGLIISHF
jgi:3-oxoacyl-[acyl-carrier-protein] synthase-3